MGFGAILETSQEKLRLHLMCWKTCAKWRNFPLCHLLYLEVSHFFSKYLTAFDCYPSTLSSYAHFTSWRRQAHSRFLAGLIFSTERPLLGVQASNQSQLFDFQNAFHDKDHHSLRVACFCRPSLGSWLRPEHCGWRHFVSTLDKSFTRSV